MDFSFFLTDNKSGYKTNEKWFSKNYPQEYIKIIDYSNKINLDLNFKEKLLFYFKNLTERPKCVTCGSDIKFRNRFDKPYGEFCSLICINTNNDEMKKRISKTLKQKYGVNYFPEHNSFIDKQKKTKLIRYGDENYTNVEKAKETKINKYGIDNYNNNEQAKKTCLLKYGVDNYAKSNHFTNKLNNFYKTLYPDIKFKEIKKQNIKIECNDCNKECEMTKQLLYERYKRNYVVCTHCNPIGNSNKSGYEKEIIEFLTKLNINYIGNKTIPNKKTQIDIFLPDFNLGIEINGLYWHNELFRDKNYHLNKTVDCISNGIDLIHIFEDEYLYKKEIVYSIIKNKLSLTSDKIYARNCSIKEISQKDSKLFLDANHIQGNVNSKIRLGLFHNDELVSLMTFSKGRIIMGGKTNEWELNRFANKINLSVIGAASKLLKYFIKNYKPVTLVSYSDIRLFNGNMYEKLGFKKISYSKPNYWYVINNIRKHRFNYRKSILVKEGFDENLTEKDIMFNRKIYRIYDCGNIRWELTI